MKPLCCLPAVQKVSDIWDLTKRGRGYISDFTTAGRVAFISKQEGVPGGHSLFSFSLPDSAQGKGLPSVARCAGPRPTRPYGLRAVTLPTLCGGGAAARPVTALQAVTGNVAAKAAPAARPGQVGRLRCSGAPFRAARPSTFGARSARPCLAPPPRRSRRRCSGAARPPRCGGCGAVRPSGPVGGASASLASPATPTAQAGPRGSAYALAARRSGAAALAASSGQAGPRPAAYGLAPAGARNLYRRAHWRRKRRLPRASRAAGRSERRLRAGMPAVATAGKAKASPAQGGKPPTSGGLACRVPGQRGKPWRVSRPLAGLPPILQSVFGGVCCGLVGCRLSCVSVCSCSLALGCACSCLWLCQPLWRVSGRFWLGLFSVCPWAFPVPCGGSAGFLCRWWRVGFARWLFCRCAAAGPVCLCAGVSACWRSGRGHPCGRSGPPLPCAGLAVQSIKKAPPGDKAGRAFLLPTANNIDSRPKTACGGNARL